MDEQALPLYSHPHQQPEALVKLHPRTSPPQMVAFPGRDTLSFDWGTVGRNNRWHNSWRGWMNQKVLRVFTSINPCLVDYSGTSIKDEMAV